MTTPALELRGLCKSYGALKVTRDVNLTLAAGARHALIGPNGAGKSTMVHLITGVAVPTSGNVLLAGEDISRASAEKRVKLGMARTFQINSLFMQLSVAENIALAISSRMKLDGKIGRGLALRGELMDEAAKRLSSLGLLELAQKMVQELAYGQRRQIEIALALALDPKVLLLDEPLAGVPSTDGKRMFELLERLPKDVAVMVIEHDMEVVFRFAERITVLVEGGVLLEGTVDEVRSDSRVRDVYLGKRNHHV